MHEKFDWDRGNTQKSLLKHGITNREAESVFADPKKKYKFDLTHSGNEKRYICWGVSEFGRLLHCVFTLRKGKTRIISTRIANEKERRYYES